MRALFPEAGYGFLEAPDGSTIYFHRNSVLHDAFERLVVGMEVTFLAEEGDGAVPLCLRTESPKEGAMRIVFTTEGGVAYFPGLSRPAMIDSDHLTAAEAAELEWLLDSAHFFDLPEDSRALRRGAADYRQYTISVENGARHHTVHLADPVESSDLQALLDFFRAHTHPLRPDVSSERIGLTGDPVDCAWPGGVLAAPRHAGY